MNILLSSLGFLDVLAGLSLVFPNFLAFYLGVLILIKGLSSVIGSFASGFYFDFMGFVDLIAAVLLLFSFSVPWIWLLPLVKGAYSLVVGMFT